jgi:hypothetical protein
VGTSEEDAIWDEAHQSANNPTKCDDRRTSAEAIAKCSCFLCWLTQSGRQNLRQQLAQLRRNERLLQDRASSAG